MKRCLGVDYGTERIGLAISDPLGLTAQPLEVATRDDLDESLRRIADEYDIGTVVLGLPTSLGGHEGSSADAARRLGEHIGGLLGVDVIHVDERFTSRMAESALLRAGMKRKARRQTVDKVAAAIILQTYLDARSAPGHPDEGPESPDNP